MVTTWSDVSVIFQGTSVQGLVQSVTVKADSGLDFINLGSYGQSIRKKAADIIIEITSLSNGAFVNPTSCQFYNDFGNITIQRKGSDPADSHHIEFSGCILIGTRSEIDAANALATSTKVYKALSYYNLGGGFSQPIATGHYGIARACYTSLLKDDQQAFNSSCNINRQFLYSAGKASPSYLAIQYPIDTTSSITLMASNTVEGSGTMDNCTNSVTADPSGGIPGAILQSVDIDGGSAGNNGDIQLYTYNYISQTDYGLKRIIALPT